MAAAEEQYLETLAEEEKAAETTRAGEKAKVEFRFVGPVKGGVLVFAGQRHQVRDLQPGEEWLLKVPGEHEGGSHNVAFEASSGGCRIGAVKRYRIMAGEGE